MAELAFHEPLERPRQRAHAHRRGVVAGALVGYEPRCLFVSGKIAHECPVARRRRPRTCACLAAGAIAGARNRSEEHTSELQSLMRISYAVSRLKKKKTI